MEKQLDYKGYVGSICFEDGQYWGEVLNLPKTLALYEGNTIEELEKDFRNCVEDLLVINDLKTRFSPITVM